MDVADRLYSGYGRQNVPDQRRILREGNAYLLAEYPKLDFVKTATIEAGASRRRRTERYALGGESVSGNPSTPRTNSSSGSAPRISIDLVDDRLGHARHAELP